MKQQAISYSRLSDFDTCPLQCYFKHFAPKKDRIKFVQSAQGKRGEVLHKQNEIAAQQLRVGLTPDYGQMMPEAAKTMKKLTPLIQQATKVIPEQQIAVNNAVLPVDYFSNDVWLRYLIDLLLLFGDKEALIVDYKTGKIKKGQKLQLDIFAFATFKRHLSLQRIRAMYVWVDHNKSTSEWYMRSDLEELEDLVREKSGLIDRAAASNEWPAKPNYLCKEWCQVPRTKCGYAGVGEV